MESGVDWTHVYDEQGVSWLTRFRGVSYYGPLPVIYDCKDQVTFGLADAQGRIGRYGPSRLTPAGFYARKLTEENGPAVRENIGAAE